MIEFLLLAIWFSLAPLTGNAVTQMAESPFSRDELYKVMLFFVDEKQAAEAVDSEIETPRLPRERGGNEREPPANAENIPEMTDRGAVPRRVRFESVRGVTYTEDTLILLSLLSSETERKVNAYRHASDRGGVTEEEERRWQDRRRVLESLPAVRKWHAKFGAS